MGQTVARPVEPVSPNERERNRPAVEDETNRPKPVARCMDGYEQGERECEADRDPDDQGSALVDRGLEPGRRCPIRADDGVVSAAYPTVSASLNQPSVRFDVPIAIAIDRGPYDSLDC